MNELKLGGRNKLCLHDVTMHKMLQKCLDNRKQKIMPTCETVKFCLLYVSRDQGKYREIPYKKCHSALYISHYFFKDIFLTVI